MNQPIFESKMDFKVGFNSKGVSEKVHHAEHGLLLSDGLKLSADQMGIQFMQFIFKNEEYS